MPATEPNEITKDMFEAIVQRDLNKLKGIFNLHEQTLKAHQQEKSGISLEKYTLSFDKFYLSNTPEWLVDKLGGGLTIATTLAGLCLLNNFNDGLKFFLEKKAIKIASPCVKIMINRTLLDSVKIKVSKTWADLSKVKKSKLPEDLKLDHSLGYELDYLSFAAVLGNLNFISAAFGFSYKEINLKLLRKTIEKSTEIQTLFRHILKNKDDSLIASALNCITYLCEKEYILNFISPSKNYHEKRERDGFVSDHKIIFDLFKGNPLSVFSLINQELAKYFIFIEFLKTNQKSSLQPEPVIYPKRVGSHVKYLKTLIKDQKEDKQKHKDNLNKALEPVIPKLKEYVNSASNQIPKEDRFLKPEKVEKFLNFIGVFNVRSKTEEKEEKLISFATFETTNTPSQ